MKYRIFLVINTGIACIAGGSEASLAQPSTVVNCVEPSMLKYWNYMPDTFAIRVNGTPLKPGKSLVLENDARQLAVRYDFSFAGGFRHGAKEVTFDLQPNVARYDISFSWKNKSRIAVTNAMPREREIKTLPYNP